jgi:hypothetical protein
MHLTSTPDITNDFCLPPVSVFAIVLIAGKLLPKVQLLGPYKGQVAVAVQVSTVTATSLHRAVPLHGEHHRPDHPV